VTINKSELKLI